MDHADIEYEYIDGLNYLKERYPLGLNPSIETLLFCQDADSVWIEIVFSEDTTIGVLKKKKTINLEYIFDDEQLSIWDDTTPLYTPEKSILDNAARFFDDADTLYQTTPILVNDDDFSEEIDEHAQADLSECEEMVEINFFVHDLFYIYITQSDMAERELLQNYWDYVASSIEGFIKGNELKYFSFSLFLQEENEKQWLSVYTDSDAITLSVNGYVYTPGVGGDTYSSWMFTIWSSGDMDGSLKLDIDKVSEMIRSGAKLQIESPNEYVCSNEDE